MSFADILGSSDCVHAMISQLQRLAGSSVTVVVTGESGVGKELVARALHAESARNGGPFVAVNCGALVTTLLESELFGHVRGAYTGAHCDRDGVFREADRGTLFLDEIGAMPLALQPKLLRVLQERVVRPLGACRDVSVDVRVICATSDDLVRAVNESRFRRDLFHRLDVVRVEVPPLRLRGADIVQLAEAFLLRLSLREGRPPPALHSRVVARLLAYSWPGNVRELRNLVERFMVLSSHDEVREGDLPEKLLQVCLEDVSVVDPEGPSAVRHLATIERLHIDNAIRIKGGNISQAALALGVNRSTLYRKLRRRSER